MNYKSGEICSHRFTFHVENHPVSVPCCWSHSLEQSNADIERAVIVVHGVRRNADEYYADTLSAAQHAGVAERTLIIAPQFLVEGDVHSFALADDVLFWGGRTGEGWKKGDPSLSTEDAPRPVNASAFEVADRMVEQMMQPGRFPNLKTVVVAGHSAGGQYVNRYAAGTQIEALMPDHIHLRFIVANPSTFVYFNGERRVGDATNQFAVPEGAEADYDDYKYGLQNLNAYMAIAGIENIQTSYPQKDVVYFLGGEDVLEAALEQSSNAMLQGVNRLQRGQVYYHYLQHFYGEEIKETQKIAIVPCVGHNHAAIFKSEAGIRSLFDC
ncbi:MAG: alpha/beta hydrolase [Candidatus Latescibacteria bacterium]|nr:alpha/beta hydrolase [Candidatus Latescibacterota bacterium]